MANRLMTPAFVTDCAIIDTGTTIHMKAGVSKMPAVMHIKTLCFVDIDCNAIQNPRAEHPNLRSSKSRGSNIEVTPGTPPCVIPILMTWVGSG